MTTKREKQAEAPKPTAEELREMVAREQDLEAKLQAVRSEYVAAVMRLDPVLGGAVERKYTARDELIKLVTEPGVCAHEPSEYIAAADAKIVEIEAAIPKARARADAVVAEAEEIMQRLVALSQIETWQAEHVAEDRNLRRRRSKLEERADEAGGAQRALEERVAEARADALAARTADRHAHVQEEIVALAAWAQRVEGVVNRRLADHAALSESIGRPTHFTEARNLVMDQAGNVLRKGGLLEGLGLGLHNYKMNQAYQSEGAKDMARASARADRAAAQEAARAAGEEPPGTVAARTGDWTPSALSDVHRPQS